MIESLDLSAHTCDQCDEQATGYWYSAESGTPHYCCFAHSPTMREAYEHGYRDGVRASAGVEIQGDPGDEVPS